MFHYALHEYIQSHNDGMTVNYKSGNDARQVMTFRELKYIGILMMRSLRTQIQAYLLIARIVLKPTLLITETG